MRPFFAVCVLAASSLLAHSAHAYSVPAIEAFFGASNIVATTGNGAVTVGVSDEGDVSVLTWPSPTYYDHLQYVASNAADARNLEHAGALPSMGVFGGMFVELSDGTKRMSWLRDDPWTASVTYSAPDSAVVETTFFHPGLRLTVRQYDISPPDLDVWIRRYVVERAPSSDVVEAHLIGYSNLSPSATKVAQLPIADFAFEHHQDFLAVWDEQHDAILQFHPGDTGVLSQALAIARIQEAMRRDFGPLGELLAGADVDPGDLYDEVVAIDSNYAPGVYIAHASIPAATEIQIGADDGDVCGQIDRLADNIKSQLDSGVNPGFSIPASIVDILRCGDFEPIATPARENLWLLQPTSAFDDAQDGELQGSTLAGAQANTAMKVPILFADGKGEATLFYSFGETRAASAQALNAARAQDVSQTQASVEAGDAAYVATLEIPAQITGDFREFVVRSFLNLRVGTDRSSSAVVASISRQPSYHVDWPRDGVFFNVALDLAGQHALVEDRLRFYGTHMRREAVQPTPILNTAPPGWPDDPNIRAFPPGSWEMNYYGDGTPGGNIRLEIDNTALVVWNIVEHVGHLDDPAARLAWLEEMWPVLEESAEFLAYWRDPETGLIWPANEDDHIEYTQGMQGSGSTFAALRAAAMAARALGNEEHALRWAARAGELRRAILTHLMDAEGRFIDQPPWIKPEPGSATEWLAWPIRLLDWDDERLRAQVREGLDRHLAGVRGERPRGQYPTKAATSAALVFSGEPDALKGLEIAELLATDIATPDTYMLGEVYSFDDVDGDGEFDRVLNIQGNPHLWSAILVFITAHAFYEPEAFDRYLEVLPAVALDPEPTGGSDMGMEPSQPDMGSFAPDVAGEDVGPFADAQVSGSSCRCAEVTGSVDPSIALVALGLGLVTLRRRRSTS